MTLSEQTGYIVPQEYEIYYLGAGTTQTHNKTIHSTEKVINTLQPGLCGDNPLVTIMLPQRSLSSQSLGKY